MNGVNKILQGDKLRFQVSQVAYFFSQNMINIKSYKKLLFKHEVNGAQQEAKAYKVFELERFLEHKNGKEAKDNKGDDLLDYFKLEGTETAYITKSVGRHHQAIFKKSNTPTYQNGFP